MEQWINLVPLPVALGMVLYVNHKFDEHIKNCGVKEKLEYMHNDLKEEMSQLREDFRSIKK